MPKAKKTEVKPVEKKKCCEVKDIDAIRGRINELYVIMEGMSSRLDEIERTANKAANRLGI